MKRLWVILGALAMVCALNVTVASAQSLTAPSWVVEPLMFRTNAAANPAPGYVDSVSFNRLNHVSSATVLSVACAETTTAISTNGWALPPSGGVLPDSVATCVLFLSDGGSSATLTDSVYVSVQVSADGSNWLYVNPVANVAGVNILTTTTTQVAGWPIPNAAGATTTTPKVFMKKWVKAAAGGAQYPDMANFYMWPLIRFIVVNDVSSGAAVRVNLKASVGHWSALASR